MTAVLFLAVPILDIVIVCVARIRRGISVTQGGRNHLSHRLVALGLSNGAAVGVLISVQLVVGVLAASIGHGGIDVVTGVSWALLVLGSLAVIAGRASVFSEAPLPLRALLPSAVGRPLAGRKGCGARMRRRAGRFRLPCFPRDHSPVAPNRSRRNRALRSVLGRRLGGGARRRRSALVLAATIAGAAVVLVTAPPLPAGEVTDEVHGEGCSPGETVVVAQDSVTVATGHADGAGRFALEVDLDESLSSSSGRSPCRAARSRSWCSAAGYNIETAVGHRRGRRRPGAVRSERGRDRASPSRRRRKLEVS